MKKTYFLIIFLIAAGALDAGVITTQEKARAKAFPKAVTWVAKALALSPKQASALEAALGRKPMGLPEVHEAQDAQGKPLGWVMVDEELGKHRPITYMVSIDTKGRIVAVDLLIYRESHGDGVRSRRFRGQFKGKTLNDPLKLNRDLDAVSGATISSRTFADGARKCLWLAAEWFGAGSHPSKKPQTKTETGGTP